MNTKQLLTIFLAALMLVDCTKKEIDPQPDEIHALYNIEYVGDSEQLTAEPIELQPTQRQWYLVALNESDVIYEEALLQSKVVVYKKSELQDWISVYQFDFSAENIAKVSSGVTNIFDKNITFLDGNPYFYDTSINRLLFGKYKFDLVYNYEQPFDVSFQDNYKILIQLFGLPYEIYEDLFSTSTNRYKVEFSYPRKNGKIVTQSVFFRQFTNKNN